MQFQFYLPGDVIISPSHRFTLSLTNANVKDGNEWDAHLALKLADGWCKFSGHAFVSSSPATGVALRKLPHVLVIDSHAWIDCTCKKLKSVSRIFLGHFFQIAVISYYGLLDIFKTYLNRWTWIRFDTVTMNRTDLADSGNSRFWSVLTRVTKISSLVVFEKPENDQFSKKEDILW